MNVCLRSTHVAATCLATGDKNELPQANCKPPPTATLFMTLHRNLGRCNAVSLSTPQASTSAYELVTRSFTSSKLCLLRMAAVARDASKTQSAQRARINIHSPPITLDFGEPPPFPNPSWLSVTSTTAYYCKH